MTRLPFGYLLATGTRQRRLLSVPLSIGSDSIGSDSIGSDLIRSDSMWTDLIGADFNRPIWEGQWSF